MSVKARSTLLKIYKTIAKCRLILYGACTVFYFAYVLKYVIRTGSPEILGFVVFLAASVLVIAVLPFYRNRFFALDYVIELIFLPVLAALLIFLVIMGFASENELAGIMSCSAIFAEAVYSNKVSKHESDF